jgi:hypothetical protein
MGAGVLCPNSGNSRRGLSSGIGLRLCLRLRDRLSLTCGTAGRAVPTVKFLRHMQPIGPVSTNVATAFHAFRDVTVGPHAVCPCRLRAKRELEGTAARDVPQVADPKRRGAGGVRSQAAPRTCGGAPFCRVSGKSLRRVSRDSRGCVTRAANGLPSEANAPGSPAGTLRGRAAKRKGRLPSRGGKPA